MSSFDVMIHTKIWDSVVDGMLSFHVLTTLLVIRGIACLKRLLRCLDKVRSEMMTMVFSSHILQKQKDRNT